MRSLLLITISMLLSLTIITGCQTKPQVYNDDTVQILTKTVGKTGDYISRNFLRYYGPKDLNEDKQKELKTAFINFLEIYDSVKPEYRNMEAVKKFLVLYLKHHHTYNPSNSSKEFLGSSPLAVANTLLTQTGLDLTVVDDKSILKNYCDKLAISEQQLYNGIYFLLVNGEDRVVNMQANL